MVLKLQKQYFCYFSKKYHHHDSMSKKKCMNLAVDFWVALEIFAVVILNNLHSMKDVLKECLPLNFTLMKFKEICTEKR